MNGFQVFNGGLVVDPARIVPLDCADSYAFQRILEAESLLTWGNANGDIHHVSQGDESFLLLSGYVLEINTGLDFPNQNEAAKFCLARINELDSIEALGKWLHGLHGSYGIFYRNRRRNQTLCITDRVSSRPLWKKWRSSGWIVSSHPMSIELSAPSRRFDETGLGALLLYGGPVDPCQSLFRGIAGTPPGSITSLDGKGNCTEYRWHRFKHVADDNLTLSNWVDLISERLLGAASRLVDAGENMAVFFSGGTDSRLAAAALKAAGGDPLLVTLGDAENLEVRVARLAAKALGLRHKVILRDPQWYLRSLPQVIYETGGSYVWTHGHFAEAAANIAVEFDVASFVLGDLCEAFSKLCCSVEYVAHEWTPESFTAAFDLLRLPLYRPANREATLSLLNPQIRPDVENSLRQRIVGLYTAISSASDDPYIVGDQCMRWESVQTIPTFFMFLDLRSKIQERNIMLDFDVHGLLETLPPRFRNESNLGALLIKKLHPKAAWVVNSNSMLPMFWPPAVHKIARRAKPLLGKLRRSLFDNSYRTTGSWPKHSVLYTNNPEWRQRFEEVLNNVDLFDQSLFDRDAIRICWEQFINGDADRVGDVEKLVQLGLLSRMLDVH